MRDEGMVQKFLVHNTGMVARVTTILDIATAWKQVGDKFKHGIETTVDFIRDLFIHQKKIHVEISDILKQIYPGEKGFRERPVSTVKRTTSCAIVSQVTNWRNTYDLQLGR